MNVAIDTNVLAYAEGMNGASRKQMALHLLETLAPESTFVPVQVLGELFGVLVRKAGWSRATAGAAVLSWGDALPAESVKAWPGRNGGITSRARKKKPT